LPKIVKIPLIILISVLAFALILLALFQTRWFKNYAAQRATAYLSEELGVPVSIGDLELSYFDALTAKDVFIADQNKDTLIYIGTLKANYDFFSFTGAQIPLDEVTIADATVNLGIPKGSKQLNLQFLVDYFTPPPTGKPVTSPAISFDKVAIVNTKFRYFNKNYAPPSDRAFDENDMLFTGLNGHLHDFTIINDSLSFTIEDLSGKEKSGLTIDKLSAETIISSTTMQFRDLVLETPQSSIGDYLAFSYSSYGDFSDFIEVVKLDANLKKSSVHTDDLALFSNTLKKYNELITAHGNVSGTIADLTSKNLKLAIGNHTRFDGAARLTGLPDIYTTQFDVKANQLTTNAIDLAKLIELKAPPKEFLNLGAMEYTGTFNGLISDFETDALLSSDIGQIIAKLHYTQLPKGSAKYKGTIRSEKLDLKMLFGDPDFGDAIFDLALDGQGLSINTLKTTVVGNINQFTYNDYSYQNIRLNGSVANLVFVGKFDINDPNFKFTLDGRLDAYKKVPEIDITTNVTLINLKQLGLDSVDNIVKFNGKIALKGDDIDKLVGTVELDSFRMEKQKRTYKLKDIVLHSSINEDIRDYSLTSDVLNITLKGDFLPSEIEGLIGYLKHAVYPSQFDKPLKPLVSKQLELLVDVPKYQPIFSEFLGTLYFDSARIALEYDYVTGEIASNNFFKTFKYDVVSSPFIDIKLKNGGEQTPINFGINSGGLKQNDSTIFEILNANGFISDGVVNFETTAQRDSILDIVLTGRFIYQNDSALVYLDDSKVDVYDKSWNLTQTSFPNFIYENGITQLRYFDFRNGNEILFLDASFGYKANKVNAILSNFSLENLTPFLAGYNLKLNGTTNGFIDVSDRNGFPIIEADLLVEYLQLDKDTLGNLELLSHGEANLLGVTIDGKISGGLLNDMEILGDINFKSTKSPLNLKLTTERSSIKPFERYLTGLASNIHGYSTSEISITGPLTSPNLKGKMQLDSLDFVVDYIQTHYKGQATVAIDYNSFTITKAQLVDRFGQVGNVEGGINHKNFNDFTLGLYVKNLENFEIMNTTQKDNDLFYGTAFVDGSMRVSGPLDDILLTINAKSRKGTEIVIPLETSDASGKLSYVEFVNLKTIEKEAENIVKSTAGVRMDFNFEITNDANIKLVFDELLGDKIEASGHGNLRMEINTFGDFNMYGGLTIDRGNYLFTALDLISKYFTVKPGGTLFWDGNPYNARISLEAIKREYTSPKPLMSGTSADLEEYNQNIAVDCNLKLTGLLFNPQVKFDLIFPSQNNLGGAANSALNTAIDRVKLDQEEIDRQVFALLVLGTFVTPSFSNGVSDGIGIGAANTGINSLSDFASSQLNNWLGQLDTRLQVGVDYQTSYKNQAELVLSLRRKFLNDRLEVSYSIDAVSQGSRPYDISVKYNITEDGSLKVRGFQKQANDPTLGNITNVNTTGVGLFYRYQFDKFRFRKKKIEPTEESK
jgi:hypothetical protein